MANSAFTHNPTITVPGSSTNTALVRWSGTGADTFLDSTIIVGATTMGLAADTDLLTFGNGTLQVQGAVTGVTSLTASAAVTGATLVGTITTATQNSITTMTALTSVATIGTGVWNGTAIVQAYIGAEAINESKMQVSNGPTNGYVLTARNGVTGGFTWEAASGTTITNNADNYVITGSASANTLTAESTLTFAANVLTLSGSSRIDFQGGSLRSPSSTILDIYASTTHQIRMDTGNNPDTVTIQVADFHVAAGNIVIGTAGKGIDFSATANSSGTMTSELFDDYEEGTFTPTLLPSFGGGSGSVTTYSTQVGRYTKIGNRVIFNLRMTIPDIGNLSGNIKVGGLPFTSVNVGDAEAPVFSGIGDSLSITAGTSVAGWVGQGDTVIFLLLWDDAAGTTYLQASEYSAGGILQLGGAYETAT